MIGTYIILWFANRHYTIIFLGNTRKKYDWDKFHSFKFFKLTSQMIRTHAVKCCKQLNYNVNNQSDGKYE